MLYHLYEFRNALLSPVRIGAEVFRASMINPWNPLAHTQVGRTLAASAEMFERTTRRFGEPDWMIKDTLIDEKKFPFP